MPQKFNLIREEFRRKVEMITSKKMKYIKSLFVRTDSEEGHEEENPLGVKIIKELNSYVEHAENVFASLFALLKHIRNKSARFFFMSDEQVLNILSMASEPQVFYGSIIFIQKNNTQISPWRLKNTALRYS